LADSDWFRPGVGFRAERVTGPNTFPAYIPYVVLGSPNNEFYTLLMQIEYRHQHNNRAFFFDFSIIF
jgi:hypothetical protein